MMTMTHMLVAAAATTRSNSTKTQVGLAWLAGCFADLSVVAMVIYARLTGFEGNMWRKPAGLYWVEPWQFFSAVTNSIPLYAAILLLGYVLYRRAQLGIAQGEPASGGTKWAQALMIFGGGALLHVLFDFPVHTDDAHVHFWPFTEWRFNSGVSYYQPSNYGNVVGWIQLFIGLFCLGVLIRRFKTWPVIAFAVFLVLPHLLQLIPREWRFAFFQFFF